MYKKTYGAPNYMDWVAQIPAGQARVKVHFTGGALTMYGVTPAEYTTTSAFIQTVIEQSQYFKQGRITLLKSVEIADAKPAVTKAKKATVAKAAAETKDEKDSTDSKDSAEVTSSESEATAADEAADPSESEEAEATEAGATEESSGKVKVEVTCLQDAQDYLQQNYGISSYKVRTRATAQQVASEHGVEFVGAGFVSADAATTEEAESTEASAEAE